MERQWESRQTDIDREKGEKGEGVSKREKAYEGIRDLELAACIENPRAVADNKQLINEGEGGGRF